jgi:transglutaminase-like putative cysteine protease
VIYDITHISTYAYAAPVASTRGVIRLLPRDDDPGQKVVASAVETTPTPQLAQERRDFFGNRVIEAQVNTPHAKLRVVLLARVEVHRPHAPAAALTPEWREARRLALSAPSLAASSPVHALFAARLTPLDEAVTSYASESFPAGRTVLEGALDLMRRIHADFVYDARATKIGTPIAQVFAKRRGVCQDFAHLMIAGLRGLGLPAAYVSGYIRTLPVGGLPTLEGADASHAWVSVWCGPAFGWIGLDPTNCTAVGNDHVVVAIGRDYSDVSPIDGVVHGSGEQDLEVRVAVIPLVEAG